MPRYYFDLTDDKVIHDLKGKNLPNLREARQHAIWVLAVPSFANASWLNEACTQFMQAGGEATGYKRRSSVGAPRYRTFEPVSTEMQPVSGPSARPISDIGNSRSKDSPWKIRAPVGNAPFPSPETLPFTANPRKCRQFTESGKTSARDRGGWLTTQSHSNPSRCSNSR